MPRSATRSPRRTLAPPLLLVALIGAGCVERTADVTPADFTPMTTGDPQERWDHLARLEQKFGEAEAGTPSESRKMADAFTTAVLKTTQSIVDDPKTSPELRETATKTMFLAYDRRKRYDPKAEEQLIEATRRIEAANRDTPIATLAAQERTRTLGQIAQRTRGPEHRARYGDVVDSIIYTARLNPPPERIVQVLFDTAQNCERERLFDYTRKIYQAMIDLFPKDHLTEWARGAIHRFDLLGKPIDDLEGPALGDEGKTISVKDFRGKVVLVVFWVSSLEPSGLEMLEAEKLRKQLDPKDFVVLGVCLDPDVEIAQAFLKEKKIDWPQIHSPVPNPDIEAKLLLRYGVKFLTYKMVVDREGRLVEIGDLVLNVQPKIDELLGVKTDLSNPPKEASKAAPEAAKSKESEKTGP